MLNQTTSDLELARFLQEQYEHEAACYDALHSVPKPDVNYDGDYLLASQLQEEMNKPVEDEGGEEDDMVLAKRLDAQLNNKSTSSGARHEFDANVNIPSAEAEHDLIDPTPDLTEMFFKFNQLYFWNRLVAVEVKWSKKMTKCAGLCHYNEMEKFCSVRLSEPLLKLRPRRDFIETLLHEMIHAYLFVTENNRDHDDHGPNFHEHMYRINKSAKVNITVYHSFHDEVEHYLRHVWKCNGPCQSRPPYYGLVKRSMNRVPGPNDTWWKSHQQTCGGRYYKIEEPEGFGDKKKSSGSGNSKGNSSNDVASVKQPTKTLDHFFTQSSTTENNPPQESNAVSKSSNKRSVNSSRNKKLTVDIFSSDSE